MCVVTAPLCTGGGVLPVEKQVKKTIVFTEVFNTGRGGKFLPNLQVFRVSPLSKRDKLFSHRETDYRNAAFVLARGSWQSSKILPTRPLDRTGFHCG